MSNTRRLQGNNRQTGDSLQSEAMSRPVKYVRCRSGALNTSVQEVTLVWTNTHREYVRFRNIVGWYDMFQQHTLLGPVDDYMFTVVCFASVLHCSVSPVPRELHIPTKLGTAAFVFEFSCAYIAL
jgi:hypothetical protein